jgi:hypothetical protein
MPDHDDNEPAPWLTAMLTYEGMPLALRVRPNVDTANNRAAYPHLAVATHELAKVKSNGLPEDSYNRSLMQFDLSLQAAISASGEGIVFLVETFSGTRNYYACVSDTASFSRRVKPFVDLYPEHVVTLATHPDRAWKFYNDYRKDFPW